MDNWRDDLSEQELELLNTAQVYAAHNLKGVPGHHMMLLCAKLVLKLDEQRVYPSVLTVRPNIADALDAAMEKWLGEKKNE